MASLFWLYLAGITFLGMFLLVPLKKVKDFLTLGLYFGVLLGLTIMFVGVNLFNL